MLKIDDRSSSCDTDNICEQLIFADSFSRKFFSTPETAGQVEENIKFIVEQLKVKK